MSSSGGEPVPGLSSPQAYRPLRPPSTVEDKDACALYATVERSAAASHEPIERALAALQKMLHRAGNVDGEGDGCGVLIDIPRKIWAEEIRTGGHASHLALDPSFAVAHVFIPRRSDITGVQAAARETMSRLGVRVLAEREDAVDPTALGPSAREEEPMFWQVGGLIEDPRMAFELVVQLEETHELQVASLSTTTCVYKVMGTPSVLGAYFPDLHDGRAETAAVLGHNRYSTNTWPSFTRVQPFSILGHNGEINTIAKLRQEAEMLDVPLPESGSDSQDLNRTVEALIHRGGLSLVEALELVLPPIVNEIRGMPEELRGFYMYLRQAFGPFAQGPVALLARFGDECVFSTDALGLRPLWHVETSTEHVFSSEPGVVAISETIGEPKPLAPGEKVMVAIERERGRSRLFEHAKLQHLCCTRWRERTGDSAHDAGFARAIPVGGPTEGPEIPGYTSAGPAEPVKVEDRVLGGVGG